VREWFTWKRVVTVIVCVIVTFAAVRSEIRFRAAQTAELTQNAIDERTRLALCEFRSELRHRYSSSVRFIAMTPEERIDKYGPTLGTIPLSTIRQNAANQKATLDSLGDLPCLPTPK
jgi:hypothetical protein